MDRFIGVEPTRVNRGGGENLRKDGGTMGPWFDIASAGAEIALLESTGIDFYRPISVVGTGVPEAWRGAADIHLFYSLLSLTENQA